jgi:hypothetical protein
MDTKFGKDMIAKKITKKQSADAGSAFVLILLLVGLFTGNVLFYKLAIPALLINMIEPRFYYPFGLFWYTLSNVLGYVVSRILMTVIYSILVVPIGLIRRLIGKDSLNLNKFKKDRSSILKVRNYTFTSKDITNPY